MCVLCVHACARAHPTFISSAFVPCAVKQPLAISCCLPQMEVFAPFLSYDFPLVHDYYCTYLGMLEIFTFMWECSPYL